ncbi:MAG: hypothetical protein ACR2KT_00110 [Methylocella sp.]|nr:MAG: hypothetical protein DLM68_13015 [Hyphomicrobiales bacterium]
MTFDADARVERTLSRDGDATIAACSIAGIDVAALASQLQTQGAMSFDDSRQDLLDFIGTKRQALA